MPNEFDDFAEWPGLRAELIAFINERYADMTLAQAGEWVDGDKPTPRT